MMQSVTCTLGPKPETGRLGSRVMRALLVRADEDHGAESRTRDSSPRLPTDVFWLLQQDGPAFHSTSSEGSQRDNCPTLFLMHTLPWGSRRSNKNILFLLRSFFTLQVWRFSHMYVCSPHICSACGSQKRVLDPLGNGVTEGSEPPYGC